MGAPGHDGKSARRGANHFERPLRASVAIGLTPRRSDRYAISWMGIVAASFGREKRKHESGTSKRPRAPTGIHPRGWGDGPDDPGEFVGDSNHGLVVSPRAVDLPSPGAELVGRARTDVCRAEHGAPALGEEHTQVGVATLGDASEAANVATGVFLGNQAEVAREAAPRWESGEDRRRSPRWRSRSEVRCREWREVVGLQEAAW